MDTTDRAVAASAERAEVERALESANIIEAPGFYETIEDQLSKTTYGLIQAKASSLHGVRVKLEAALEVLGDDSKHTFDYKLIVSALADLRRLDQ